MADHAASLALESKSKKRKAAEPTSNESDQQGNEKKARVELDEEDKNDNKGTVWLTVKCSMCTSKWSADSEQWRLNNDNNGKWTCDHIDRGAFIKYAQNHNDQLGKNEDDEDLLWKLDPVKGWMCYECVKKEERKKRKLPKSKGGPVDCSIKCSDCTETWSAKGDYGVEMSACDINWIDADKMNREAEKNGWLGYGDGWMCPKCAEVWIAGSDYDEDAW